MKLKTLLKSMYGTNAESRECWSHLSISMHGSRDDRFLDAEVKGIWQSESSVHIIVQGTQTV